MITNKGRHKKKSLCEKSMQVVVNIIKLSTFSLAGNINFRTSSSTRNGALPDKNSAILKKDERVSSMINELQFGANQKSQNPKSNFNGYMASGINNNVIDGKFSDYIERFHAKILADNSAITGIKDLTLVLPPPIHLVNPGSL